MRRPVGLEDGEYFVMRCPRDVMVSTPKSLWADDAAKAECFGHIVGRRITPAEMRRRTQRSMTASDRVEREAALDKRDRVIVEESGEANRTYAAIAQSHGISVQRVRQIVARERNLVAYLRSGTPWERRLPRIGS